MIELGIEPGTTALRTPASPGGVPALPVIHKAPNFLTISYFWKGEAARSLLWANREAESCEFIYNVTQNEITC